METTIFKLKSILVFAQMYLCPGELFVLNDFEAESSIRHLPGYPRYSIFFPSIGLGL